MKALSHEATIYNRLVDCDIPTGIAAQAAVLMAEMQNPNLPVSPKLPDLIAAFLELYAEEGAEALEVLKPEGKSKPL